ASAAREIYSLSLHDALPILGVLLWWLAPDGTDEWVGSTPEPGVNPADDDLEPGPSWDGLELLELDDLSRLDVGDPFQEPQDFLLDRKSTRLNSSHVKISYAV